MKIKMLDTRTGTENGFDVRAYEKSKHYNVTHNLGTYFISRGYATESVIASPEEYKGVMDFCQFCRGRINTKELSAAWEEYSKMILEQWDMNNNVAKEAL